MIINIYGHLLIKLVPFTAMYNGNMTFLHSTNWCLAYKTCRVGIGMNRPARYEMHSTLSGPTEYNIIRTQEYIVKYAY